MKRLSLLTLLLVASVAVCFSDTDRPRQAQWEAAEKAANGGFPKTAIDYLQPIEASATADGAWAEAARALLYRIQLESEIQAGKPQERILQLQAALPAAPEAVQPILEAVLARWYWGFFQSNRRRFQQRTQIDGESGSDLLTWDLPRILREVDRHFAAALANAAALQSIPISNYDALLQPGTAPDACRPTLFDFLAYQALEFYTAGEQGAIEPEENGELAAVGPIFGDTAAFLAWEPTAAECSVSYRQAVRMLQQLLRFHSADADRSAYLDAELSRLVFASKAAVGETKDERYRAALERFITNAGKHESAARALALLAQSWRESDPPRAHACARRGQEVAPGSIGAAQCTQVIAELEAKSAQLKTERIWNAPWPTLDLTYRNLTKVWFRAIALDYRKDILEDGLKATYPDDLKTLLHRPAAHSWENDLPATADFRSRTEHLPAPTGLRPGCYLILASFDPTFSVDENQLSTALVWVSDLSLVLREDRADGGISGFVLQAQSGEPIAGAEVRLVDNKGKVFHTMRTDAQGCFHIAPMEELRGGFVIWVAAGGHEIPGPHRLYGNGSDAVANSVQQTVFFTDRAIYRPGQTISYKGISLRANTAERDYAVLAKQQLVVAFRDANGQEVARATHTTNGYGSFSGTFTAPRDRLPGWMNLVVIEGPAGQTGFSVEEYKRPKFQVEIAAPSAAAKLGATVEVKGRATAYNGAPIGGAKVRWRVERATLVPAWCWWWQPPSAKQIAHGSALTDADGSFTLSFAAAPDRSVSENNEPVFTFSVHADVTDTSGETRSADRSVRAGYAAMAADLTVGAWQTRAEPVALSVRTVSLDGVPQTARGTVKVCALRQPEKVQRAPLPDYSFWEEGTLPSDPSNPETWEEGERVSELPFETDDKGFATVSLPLPAGIYRATLATSDRFGRPVSARTLVRVVDPRAKHCTERVPNRLVIQEPMLEPGEKLVALWGTGYERGRAFVELECAGKTLQSYWTKPGRTQARIELPITEAMRGGITLRTTFVRENRAYLEQRLIDVPWSNKELSVRWESFRSKLQPGQKETWTAVVSGPDATRAAAEMVATLYDASLDQFRPNNWPRGFGFYRRESIPGDWCSSNESVSFLRYNWLQSRPIVANTTWTNTLWSYRTFWEIGGKSISRGACWEDLESRGYRGFGSLEVRRQSGIGSSVSVMTAEFCDKASTAADTTLLYALNTDVGGSITAAAPQPDLSKIAARRNLSETAFFFPQLLADEDGKVRLNFTLPEALTEWRFLGFAHDRQLRAGLLSATAVTSKELMVEPNPPRFLREGDVLEFTAKVSNRSDLPQSGRIALHLSDAATLSSADAALGNLTPEQEFTVPAGKSCTYSWRLSVPDGQGFLTYKVVGATTGASDGEEGFLPVLSRRILVTESLPLTLRGPGERSFSFKKLLASGHSVTLRHQSLTVQMVSQPAWQAVLALPYLMEYPYDCSEQVFSRAYANALARHIANSDPKIRRIFELWKNTPALDSPLEKNADLKSILLEETPWVRQAQDESAARRQVGLLFDSNRLETEVAAALATLSKRQRDDGLWPWFPGGPTNEYISLHIATGFGRLRQLGVAIDTTMAAKAWDGLDAWMVKRVRETRARLQPESWVPGHLEAIYLYGRSFFLAERPLAADAREAVDYLLAQARCHWMKTDCRMCQAQLALALQRFGDRETPAAIVRSIKEHSVNDPELGRYWNSTEWGYWWYQAPVETQATMIEALSEVAGDAAAVEECQVWLLQQKRTQGWRATKATADAVFALLLGGRSPLASDAQVEISLGGVPVQPEKVEAGTGFYQQRFVGNEVHPEQGRITARKTDEGVSWGSVHWQYLEQIDKITPSEATPLQLTKTLFVKETTDAGPRLRPMSQSYHSPVSVGDEIVVRLVLCVSRDLEFVHLKDQRGSGTEPVDVFSGYRWSDGLGYYAATRDTATHFFFEYLPKGTYTLEYSVRVQHRGSYPSGLAEIQCLYAPEFSSHSDSTKIEVRSEPVKLEPCLRFSSPSSSTESKAR